MNKVEVRVGKVGDVLATGIDVMVGSDGGVGWFVEVKVAPAVAVRVGNPSVGASAGWVVDGWIVPVDLRELSGVIPTTLGMVTGISCCLGLQPNNETISINTTTQ